MYRDIKEVIEDIKQKITIQDAIDLCGIYPAKNRNQYHCPFHGEDKKPSASIAKGFFNCFTCHIKLDCIGFIAKYMNISQGQAIKLIDEHFNLGLHKKLSKDEMAKIKLQDEKRKNQREKEKRYNKFLNNIQLEIIDKIKMYEKIMDCSYITQKEYSTGEWEYECIYYYALKEKMRLESLLDIIQGNPPSDGYSDFIYGTNIKDIMIDIKLGRIDI